ncbi:outer membrane lipoprotein carrier protein LolA [Streptomyces sp. NPDC048496]|uniref:LolA family protein n=1 Tax=Streptomyces sp. NPDC048496 TaxID=3365558 RepID=UPI003716ECFD
MAPNDSAETTGSATSTTAARRKAARYVVPVAVAGVAAATIGLVPALADTGDPELPKISAQQLIEKIAASDTQQLSGTVRVSTDLGIPSLGGLAESFARSAGGETGGSSAAPKDRLTELASGTHTLRVAADGPDKQRVSILDSAAEYSVIRNGDQLWAYDSKSDEAYHATTDKAPDAEKRDEHTTPDGVPTTPKALAEQALKAADSTTSVTVGGTAQVAGRDAYKLVIKPKQGGSTIGAITVAVDAKNGVPLKFTLSPSGGGKAVIDAGFTSVDFARPAASSFTFTPPKGAKVTEADEAKAEKQAEKNVERGPEGLTGLDGFAGGEGTKVIGEGWGAIYAIEAPGAKGLPTAEKNADVPPAAQQFLDSFGDKVTGKFGSGTVFKTRLVNALMTDDGKVYVGAVTKDALVKAADSAAH